MVNYSPDLDNTFSALSSPVRRGMLARLAHGWATVSELAEPFDISLPAISRHLRILEQAGLVRRVKRGRVHYCRLVPGPIQAATDCLTTYQMFWEAQLDSLADFLAGEKGENEHGPDQQ